MPRTQTNNTFAVLRPFAWKLLPTGHLLAAPQFSIDEIRNHPKNKPGGEATQLNLLLTKEIFGLHDRNQMQQ